MRNHSSLTRRHRAATARLGAWCWLVACVLVGSFQAGVPMAQPAPVATVSPTIQTTTTPAGIQLWLVQTKALPMLNLEVNIRAGSAFEPATQHGLAHLTASLFDEGAGPYTAKQFKEELEAIGARFSGSADTQDISLNLTTLSEHAPRAIELLGLAATQPQFKAADVNRIKATLLADIRRGDEDPSTVAWRLFRPALYGKHPYANNGEGTLTSVKALTPALVKKYHATHFTKANLSVVAVGDITLPQLTKLVDAALGSLPKGTKRNAITTKPTTPKPRVITKAMQVPQGTVLLGHLGLERTSPDYPAFLVMNEILGGGVLTSRLGADVREKHGLAYDVRSVNQPLPHGGMFYVSLATDNAKVDQALSLVRQHLNQIITKPVTQQEFDDAKAYLIASFPMRVDSNGKLLSMLSMMQTEGLGTQFLSTWQANIAAVTLADVQRIAKQLIHPSQMVLTVVGQGPALKVK